MKKTLFFVMLVVMATESVTAAMDDATKQDIDEFIENILSCRNITGQYNSSQFCRSSTRGEPRIINKNLQSYHLKSQTIRNVSKVYFVPDKALRSLGLKKCLCVWGGVGWGGGLGEWGDGRGGRVSPTICRTTFSISTRN